MCRYFKSRKTPSTTWHLWLESLDPNDGLARHLIWGLRERYQPLSMFHSDVAVISSSTSKEVSFRRVKRKFLGCTKNNQKHQLMNRKRDSSSSSLTFQMAMRSFSRANLLKTSNLHNFGVPLQMVGDHDFSTFKYMTVGRHLWHLPTQLLFYANMLACTNELCCKTKLGMI